MAGETGVQGWSRLVAAALLGAAVTVSGCGPMDPAPGGAPTAGASVAPTPKERLVAAVPDGDEGPFRFTGTDVRGDVSGSVDPAAKAVELAISTRDPEHGFTMKMAFRVIDQESWTKISFTGTQGLTGLPKLPDRWLKLDPAKLKDADSVPTYEGADPGSAGALLEAATSVRDNGGGKYSGTIDLTAGEAAKVLDSEQMTALGGAAKQIPFTAAVGADENLASLTLDVPAAGGAKAFQYVVNYREYGSAPKLAAPAGSQAQAAPPVVYEMLNG